jgi:hypothetical protein
MHIWQQRDISNISGALEVMLHWLEQADQNRTSKKNH